MNLAVQAIETRRCWFSDALCVELIELCYREATGFYKPFRYEVRIPGEPALYVSESEYAARRYLEMLLGLSEGELSRTEVFKLSI